MQIQVMNTNVLLFKENWSGQQDISVGKYLLPSLMISPVTRVVEEERTY